MVKLPEPIDTALAEALEGTPELRRLQAQYAADLDELCPEPEVTDTLALYEDLRQQFAVFHELIRAGRLQRFEHDQLDPKQAREQRNSVRFFSRFSNNEILRTVSMQCRNDFKVTVPPAGASRDALKRSQRQTRWLQQLRKAAERRANDPLRRKWVDAQHGDSLGIVEVYLTDAYDRLKLDRMEEERDSEYLRRTERLLQQAGPPFGLRVADPLGCFYDTDEDGVYVAFIAERRPRRHEERRMKRHNREDYEEWKASDFSRGQAQPIDGTGPGQDITGDTVECIRYYDARWYWYFVDGKPVGKPKEHRMPGCPIFLFKGIPTSSPNRAEQIQGVTWGMIGLEKLFNDLVTRKADTAFTRGEPHPVVYATDVSIAAMPEQPTLRWKPGEVPYIPPGWDIKDAFAGFKAEEPDALLNLIQQIWQRNGLNPIAQGQSPGADPAGYTVNTLQNAAQNLYEVLADNEARAWETVCDFIRRMIRQTIRETVYLSVPMADGAAGGTEWLGLGPDDIDETPCEVTIDPLGDANRLAVRESLIKGHQLKYVPKAMVQRDGFGANDPDAWDREIDVDDLKAQLRPLLFQDVQSTIAMQTAAAQGAPMAGAGSAGGELPPTANGAAPAEPQPPTVGAGQAAQSQGGMSPQGRAGSDSGYRPASTLAVTR